MATKPTPTTVLLVDDRTVPREGIRYLLDNEPDLTVIGQAGTVTDALRLDLTPDVIVTEIDLPDLRNVDVITALREQYPDAEIMALTISEDLGRIREVMQATAIGYVLKAVTVDEFLAAVRGVAAGQPQLLPSRLGYAYIQSGQRPDTPLDDKGIEVLRDWAAGYTAEQTGDRIHMSKRGVEAKRKQIKDRLGMDSRAEIVAYAKRIGLLTVSALTVGAELAARHGVWPV